MKKVLLDILNGILLVINAICWFFFIIFKSVGWFFKTVGIAIAKFFVGFGKYTHYVLTKGIYPVLVKIGKFFVFIVKKIGQFFINSRDTFEKGLKKYRTTKFRNSIVKVLTYLPNKFIDRTTYRKRQALWGVVFIIPLMIGFIYFFLFPFITTIIFSFSNIYRAGVIKETNKVLGVITEWVGFDNYRYVWSVDSLFKETLQNTFVDSLLNVVMITIFSLLMAVVLNSKFRGRSFVRAIFFMPVIFNSQAVDVANSAAAALTDAMEQEGQDIFSVMFNFSDFLLEANFPVTAVNFLTNASNSIFDVISYSGVQILIFLSAIQSVPKHLYEAAKIEGATQYEIFWKITFPMVSPMMLTVGVYTVVDSFLRSELLTVMKKYAEPGNKAFTLGLGSLTNDGIYAAMSILFCLVSFIVVGIVLIVFRRMVFYYDE